MPHDPLFDDLNGAWQRQPVATGRLREKIARRNARQSLRELTKLASALAVLAIAAGFAWLFVADDSAINALAAAAFLVTAPLLFIDWHETRAMARIDHGADPAELVRAELARTRAARNLLWIDGAAAAILLACAVAALALAAAGLTDPNSAITFALLWTLSAIAIAIWQRRRRVRLTRQIHHYADLLDAT